MNVRLALVALATLARVFDPATISAQGTVQGKLAIKEKGGKFAKDLSNAVIWLEGPTTARPTQAEIVTKDKAMVPGVLVVAPGSTIAFPNLDPFNHNVFSLSAEAAFDLGLYGRGTARSTSVHQPGIVRVYCNVHAQMGAVVVVVPSPFVARPNVDGTFLIANVPAGSYRLTAWDERGGSISERLVVSHERLADLALTIDATGFKVQPHLNKFGKPYDSDGRRY